MKYKIFPEIREIFLKTYVLPQNKSHISNKSQTFTLYGCVSSYDITSCVTQT